MQLDQVTWSALVSSYESEYKDLCENWKIVESKAQATIALASVLIAAVFAVAKELPSSFGPIEKCLLSVAVLLLSLCLCTALWALKIRNMYAPPQGRSLHTVLEDAANSGIATDSQEYFGTITTNWRYTNNEISYMIDDKSVLLACAQACLAWAATLFVFLTISSIAS